MNNESNFFSSVTSSIYIFRIATCLQNTLQTFFFFFSPRVSKCFYLMLTYSEVWIWQQSPQRNWPTALFQPFLSSLHHIPPSPSLLQSKAITSDKHPLPLSFSAVSGVKQIRLDFLVLYTSVSHFLPCRLHLSTWFFVFLPVYCKPGAVIGTGLGVICIFFNTLKYDLQLTV